MLEKQGILTKEEKDAIVKGLTGMRMTLSEMGVPDTEEAMEELINCAAASGNMANDVTGAAKEMIRKIYVSRK